MTVRAFLAAVPDRTAQAAIETWAAGGAALPGRAVPPERRHLTLAFFGDLASERLDEAAHAFRVLESSPALLFPCDRWWPLPDPREARVLAVGGEAAVAVPVVANVRDLQKALRLGEPERRPFLPHVTVRRFSAPYRGPLPPEGAAFDFLVKEVALFESRLGPEGPTYRVRATYRLGSD